MTVHKTIITHSNYDIEVDDLILQNQINNHPKFKRFLDIAKSMSVQSNFQSNKLGAIIVYKGKILSRGYNSLKSHPKQKIYNFNRTDFSENAEHFTHAEMDAINKSKDMDLSKAEIYIYHTGHKGDQKMARPCAGCMDAIKQAGISTIHYSTPDGFATEYISKDVPIKVKKSKFNL